MSTLHSLTVPMQMLLAATCAFTLVDPARAEAPQQRRVLLDVAMTRQGEVSNGAERGHQPPVQAWRARPMRSARAAPAPALRPAVKPFPGSDPI